MNDPASRSPILRVFGGLLMLVGLSVFLIRFHQPGPYALPQGGNLLGGVLALVLGAWLVRPWLGASALATSLKWLAILASPVVLLLALYSTLAELEEVVVLKATTLAGEPADLRLWVADKDGAAWVTMPRSKADAHGLDAGRFELMRQGELRCVVATRIEEHEAVNEIHQLRHEKYAVQRLATVIGLFGHTADPSTVTLRLDPCPPGGGAR